MLAGMIARTLRPAILLLLAAAVACNKNPNSPTSSAPYSQTDLTVGAGTQLLGLALGGGPQVVGLLLGGQPQLVGLALGRGHQVVGLGLGEGALLLGVGEHPVAGLVELLELHQPHVLGLAGGLGADRLGIAVGPLVRDDLKTLAISGARLPWTLALNQLDDGTPLPSAIFSFPLSVESDGRMLARRALSSGARRVDVIEGDSPLMKRFSSAFATTWTSEGGRVPDAFRFDAAPDVLTQLRRTLAQNASDAVLLAVNGDRAALVKPFIGGIRAYASGLVFERPAQAVARDLDGVRVVEIPWLLTPDAPQFSGLPRRDFDSTALARLYALGLDAYRVAAAFQNGPPPRFELEGATGHVSLVPGRQFLREGSMAVYRDGELVPEPAP